MCFNTCALFVGKGVWMRHSASAKVRHRVKLSGFLRQTFTGREFGLASRKVFRLRREVCSSCPLPESSRAAAFERLRARGAGGAGAGERSRVQPVLG